MSREEIIKGILKLSDKYEETGLYIFYSNKQLIEIYKQLRNKKNIHQIKRIVIRPNDDIYFTPDHLWVRLQGAVAYIGVTDYFQWKAGSIMNVSLYSKEGIIEQFEDFAIIDSRRAISRLKMPVAGKLIETNLRIITEPSLINASPIDEGWLIKIAVISPPEIFNLMTPMEYEIYKEEQNQIA